MASLVDRNGIYYAQWHDANRIPTRRRLSLKTRQKRVARQLLTGLQNAYDVGQWDPWKDTIEDFRARPERYWSVSEVKEEYLTRKRERGLSSETLKSYNSLLRRFCESIGGNTLINNVTASNIRAFMTRGEVKRSTQRNRYNLLRGFLNWAVAEEYLSENPVTRVKPPRVEESIPKAITAEEVNTLCDSILEDYDEKLDHFDPHKKCRRGDLIWMIPLIRFAFYTGMRISELARLRWRDIDFEQRLVFIHQQKNRKAQTIPLNAKAHSAIEGLEPVHEDAFVFATARGDAFQRSEDAFMRRVSKLFVRYRRSSGMRSEITFHSLRHGFCTMLAKAGKSAVIIKKAARHSSIQTSMRYIALTNGFLKQEIEDVFSEARQS